MHYFRRAMLHTVRKKGKTTLLFFILLVMAVLILLCLSIGSAVDTARLNVRESLGGGYSIDAQYAKTKITDQVLNAISGIDGVKGVDNAYSASYAQFQSPRGSNLKIRQNEDIENPPGFEHVGRIQSNLYSDKDPLFTEDGFELTKGRHTTKADKHVILVHEDFARTNKLKVGDTMRLNLNKEMLADPDFTLRPVDVKIIGLFKHTVEQDDLMDVSYNYYENTTFIDPLTYNQLVNKQDGIKHTGADIKVNDPTRLDEITGQMKRIEGMNWQECKIPYHDADYQNAKKPLDSLENLVTISIIIITAASILLLFLILMMWMRNRLHETGMLLAMGFGKRNILFQHLAELLMVAVLSFTAAFAIGNSIAGRVGNSLLNQASAGNLTQLNVNVSLKDLGLVYCLGFFIIIVSVFLASMPAMRLKPKEILSKMS